MAEAQASTNEGADSPVDVIKLQQEFYELFGHKSSVIYDCYTSKEALEVKIDLIMPDMRAEKKAALTEIIWGQKMYTGDKYLLMSPIFICCIYDTNISTQLTYPLDIKSKRFSLHPVFRIQKCLCTLTTDDQTKCCALFVDEFARVYENWKDFREKNKYEDSLVITPKCGIYNGSAEDCVLLDIFIRKSGLTRNLDTGTTVVGLASAGVAAAAFIPSVAIAPVVVAGAAVAGLSCALYSGLRSAYDLYDRRSHKQSIALKDKDARASWINIAAGTFSASAAGATQLITQAAQSGQNISHLTRNTIRFMNVGALSLHTTGCLDGFHTMLSDFYNGEPISKVHLTQLSASLFLLTHSIRNFQAAEQLLKCDGETMKENLIQRQKTTFQHLVNETALLRGLRSDVGQVIIRSIKSLGDPKELLKLIERHNSLHSVSEATEGTPTDQQTPDSPEEVAASEQDNIAKLIEARRTHFCDLMEPEVVNEYCGLFDTRFASILNTLQPQVKNRGTSSLKEILIYLLEELDLKAFNAFLNFVQELIVRLSQTSEVRTNATIDFECFVKLIMAQFVERSTQEKYSDLSEYVLSLDDDKKQHIDFDIRQYLGEQSAESLQNLESVFDAGNVYTSELSDARKVFLMISELVELFASKFKICCATANVQELHETVEDILKRLSFESATTFFSLTKKLLDAHAMNIQLSLGRFISVDIFITDIYCLLSKFSAEHFDSLNEYLFQYTDDLYDSIETEFKNNYVLKNDLMKTSRCSICSGEIFI